MPPQTSATTKPGIPWSVKGVDLETREAAKEAARKAGMTLGEWLNTIIAETSDEGARRRARRLKDEAEREELAERIDRLARVGREAARNAVAPDIVPALERLVQESRYRNEALEQKTATALGALVGFIERSEQTRRKEVGSIATAQERTSSALRDALHLVTHRLDTLERSVAGGPGDGLAPLRQAVSRLEGRIDDLGSREAAGQFTTDIHDAMRGLEQRLVEIAGRLDAGGTAAAPLALADAGRIERLEAALGALVDRLGSSTDGEVTLRPASPDPLLVGLQEDVKGLSARMEQLVKAHAAEEVRSAPAVEALREDVGVLAKVVEALPERIDVGAVHRELASLRKSLDSMQPGSGDTAVGDRLDAVIDRLDRLGDAPLAAAELSPLHTAIEDIRARLASQGEGDGTARYEARFDALEARIAALDSGDTLGRIDTRLDSIRAELESGAAAEQDGFAALANRVERILAAVEAPVATPDFSPLQAELAAMRRKIEAASRPDSEPGALDALQAQIAAVAEKLDKPNDAGIAAIRSLENSVGELFTRIEEARRSTVEAADASARKVADEVLARAAGLPGRADDGAAADDAGMRVALDAVQDTLERIVDRLATLESDMAGDRAKIFEAIQRNTTRGASEADAPVAEPPVNQPTPQQKIAAALAAAEAARALAPKGPAPARPPQPAPEPRIFPPMPDVPVTAPAADTMSFDAILGSNVASQAVEPPASASFPADTPLEPGTGRPLGTPEALGEADQLAPESGKSAFIAAARLAAQSSGRGKAKADPKGAAKAEAELASADKPASASGRYRRPILIGLAAIVLAFAAAQVGRNLIGEKIFGGGQAPAPAAGDTPPAETGGTPAAPDATPAPDAAPAPAAPAGEKQSDASSSGSLPAPPSVAALEPAPSGQPGSFQSSAPGPDGSGFTARAPGQVQEPESVGAISPAPTLDGVGSRLPAPAVSAQGLPKGLQRAAVDGNAAATFEIASRYFEGKGVTRDTKLAATWFEKAALAGSAPAQYRIGSMYEKGVGVSIDIARARFWYQRGAEAGNVKAMHNLGVVLADGGGEKPDYAAAVQWFRKASEYGLRDSQYNLAILAARGLGMEKDLVQSWTFFALAAAQGDTDAGHKRDEVASRLDPAGLARAKAAVDGFVAAKPDPAANEVPVPPGGWDREQTGDARKDKAKSARL